MGQTDGNHTTTVPPFDRRLKNKCFLKQNCLCACQSNNTSIYVFNWGHTVALGCLSSAQSQKQPVSCFTQLPPTDNASISITPQLQIQSKFPSRYFWNKQAEHFQNDCLSTFLILKERSALGNRLRSESKAATQFLLCLGAFSDHANPQCHTASWMVHSYRLLWCFQ